MIRITDLLKHMNIRTVFAFIILTSPLFSQSNIEIGQWKSHLPHNIVLQVEQSQDKVIYATQQSIFTIDKDDSSVEYLSKVEGLTETGIEKIIYNDINDALIIAYENSVLDIVDDEGVFPIFDISNNSNFVNRKINDMFIQNDEWLYLATGFGLLQYNLQTREFGFTLDAGQKISKVDGNDNFLYIVGDNGAYYLDYQNDNFPNAFSSWTRLSEGLPNEYKAEDIISFNEKVYLATSELVYSSDDNNIFIPVQVIDNSTYDVVFLESYDNNWVLGLKDRSSRSLVMIFDDMNTMVNEINSCTNRLVDISFDDNGTIYFADDWLFVRTLQADGSCTQEVYRGPFSAEASDISIKGNEIFVASGGITDNFGDLFGRKGIYILEEGGEWNNINQENNPFFKDKDVIQFYQIEAHPSQEKVYIGSFWAGLVEYNLETKEQVLYTAANTQNAILSSVGDEQRTRISGLSFDDDDNLWIASYNASRPLSVYTNEQTWHNFDLPGDDRLTDLVVDDIGNVWAVVSASAGAVVVYNPGNNIKDPTDDLPAKVFNVSNSELPSNLVNCIAKDLDGAIWVGTGQGVVVFECGGAVFEDICQGNKPTVFQDNLGAFLLETEDVISIAVDGANRKWFGTRNGIFVQSPSGEEQIAQYNTENSPLFDNNIKAMAYSGESGEMMIATNKGLQSFRTRTTSARVVHSSNVYAFPNPVRPEYNGNIAIKGLARDAEIKITDIDGHLVFQTQALGGQAIWDGMDLLGNTVAGGVYLVFSSSSDSFRDPDTAVTKILVVR